MSTGKKRPWYPPLRALGSLWFAAVLMMLWLFAMACATVFESTHGTEQALLAFYKSRWFETLLALIALNIAAAVCVRFPFSKKQIGFVLTHVSILVTFAGALVTRHFGIDGQLALAEGETSDRIALRHDALNAALPGGEPVTVDLSGTLGRALHAVDLNPPPACDLDGTRVEVLRYLPDSEWVRRIREDAPRGRPAVEIRLTRDENAEPVFVPVGRPVQADGLSVAYRPVADAEELARLLHGPASAPADSKGTISITLEGRQYDFPVEEGLAGSVPLGDSGYAARVLRYLPHAQVGPDRKIVNASDRPVNPYVEVEITGPEGSETRRAFARYPGFESMHGDRRTPGLEITFEAPENEDRPGAPIEVLAGPDGKLYVRFDPGQAPVIVRELEVGQPVPTPWSGRELVLVKRYERAGVQWELEPVEPVRQERTPALLVQVTHSGQSEQRWLQKYRAVRFQPAGRACEVSYTNLTMPLGFGVTLEDFHIGMYPGGERPRSFESRITIHPPGGGESFTRVVSMNHPVEFGGYTLFQSSYSQQGGKMVSVLSVSRDPGRPVVFAGYVGVIVGMFIVLGIRMSESRRRAAAVSAGGPEGAVPSAVSAS